LPELEDRVLGASFLNMISENLLREHNLMLMLARKDADGRLASFLIDVSKRAQKQGKPADEIKLTMTRQDIANYLGLAIETVCRALRRFQDSGMLEVTRREVKIYDYNCLLATAGTQISC
jgi:CRP/FNR family transcriptional regulator